MFLHFLENGPDVTRRNCKPNNNQLQKMLLDFYDSGKDWATVTFDTSEYRSSGSLYSGLKKGVEALDLPINVRMFQGDVYLERAD